MTKNHTDVFGGKNFAKFLGKDNIMYKYHGLSGKIVNYNQLHFKGLCNICEANALAH